MLVFYRQGTVRVQSGRRGNCEGNGETDMTYEKGHASDLDLSPAFLSTCTSRQLIGTQRTSQDSVPTLHRAGD